MLLIPLSVAIVLYAASKLLYKKAAHEIPLFFLVFVVQVIGGCTALVLYVLFGTAHAVEWAPIVPLLVIAVGLWAFAAVANLVSIRENEVSSREVISQSRLLFVTVLSVLFLGETVTKETWIGIALISGGIMSAAYKRGNVFESLTHRGGQLAIAMSFLFAILALIDKEVSSHMDPFLYTALVYLGPALVLMFFFTRERRREAVTVLTNRSQLLFTISIGCVNALAFCAVLYAYQLADLHVVYSFIQLGSLLAVLYAFFFWGERDRALQKCIGLCIAIIGAIFIHG